MSQGPRGHVSAVTGGHDISWNLPKIRHEDEKQKGGRKRHPRGTGGRSNAALHPTPSAREEEDQGYSEPHPSCR